MDKQSIFARRKSSPLAFLLRLSSAVGAFPTAASAESYCWTNAETGMFVCLDDETGDTFSLTGNIPPAASPDIMFDGLRYHTYTGYSFDLVARGTLRTSHQFDYPFLFVTWGNVSFDGRASEIISEGGSNVALRIRAGDQLELWAGTVRNDGAFAYGIAADAGRIEVHGIRTVVGHTSVGIFAQSNYGDAIVYTGHINARQHDATGAVAFAKDWGDGYGCGTAIVNVDGKVVGAAYGVRAIGCADTEINVATDGSASSFDFGTAIETEGQATSRVTVDGTVYASLRALAMDLNGSSSTVVINGGGFVFGRYDGTDGDDTFTIQPGGMWQTRRANDFGSGSDILRNAGVFEADDVTTLAGLEKLENWGRVDLSSASLSMPGVLDNRSVIEVSGDSILSARRALVNGGLIEMANGVAGDRLLVTDRLMNRTASHLSLDVGPTASDHLQVNGAVAGQMVIDTYLLPDTPLILSPMQLVTAPVSEMDAFVLGRVTGAPSPLITYGLKKEGDSFYLTSGLNQMPKKLLVSRTFESTMWRSKIVRQSTTLLAGDRFGMSLEGSIGGGANTVSTSTKRIAAGLALASSSGGDVGRRHASITYVSDLGVTGWAFGGSASYFKSEKAAEQEDRATNGFSVQGVIGTKPQALGWHSALAIGAISFDTEFSDHIWNSLKGNRRTSSVGITGNVGYRHKVGAANIDWNAAVAARHVSSSAMSIDGIDLRAPSQTRMAVEVGSKIGLGGPLNPMIDINFGTELGSNPSLYAMVEGNSSRYGSEGPDRWLHIGTSLGSENGQGWSVGLSAEISDQSQGTLAATYRF